MRLEEFLALGCPQPKHIETHLSRVGICVASCVLGLDLPQPHSAHSQTQDLQTLVGTHGVRSLLRSPHWRFLLALAGLAQDLGHRSLLNRGADVENVPTHATRGDLALVTPHAVFLVDRSGRMAVFVEGALDRVAADFRAGGLELGFQGGSILSLTFLYRVHQLSLNAPSASLMVAGCVPYCV